MGQGYRDTGTVVHVQRGSGQVQLSFQWYDITWTIQISVLKSYFIGVLFCLIKEVI